MSGSALSSLRTRMLPVRSWCSSSDEHVVDDGVYVDRAAVELRRPGQVQQPVDDLRGAERLPLDLFQHLRPGIVLVGALEQHLREARDAGQRRIDFVRHARGEQSDRRHLLGNLELLLELHPGRDVLDDHDRSGDGAFRVPQRRGRDVDEQPPGRLRGA